MITDADDPEERAWQLWKERGVTIPEYAGYIAERRREERQLREGWEDAVGDMG